MSRGRVRWGWLVLVGWIFTAGCKTTPVTLTPTLPVIDFEVETQNGDPVSLKDYRGQIVLVNFWASWCSACKEELPRLETYYQAHRDQGLLVLGVDVSDRPSAAAETFTELGCTYPLVFDPPGNVLLDLGMEGLPQTLLVDNDGHLVHRWIGAVSEEQFSSIVEPLLLSQP